MKNQPRQTLRQQFRSFAERVNDPHKLYGPVFVLALFTVAAMVFSQSAVFMVMMWKLAGV